MAQNEIVQDLRYAKMVAEQGVEAPLVGGRFGLLWGVLLSITFFLHWAILTRVLELPYPYLGFLWLGFAVIGGAVTWMLDRSIRSKPGASSFGNRADSAIWMFFGIMMFASFLGVVAYVAIGPGDYRAFNFMVVLGFAGQGMAYGALSRITGQTWLIFPALAAFVLTVIGFYLLATATLYLAAAIGVLFSIVWPSIVQMRSEPANVG